MSSSKNQLRPTLEGCEARLALSTALPADTLGVAVGDVPAPHQVGEATTTVPARAFGHRRSIIIGETARPADGGALEPAVVAARGPGGGRLPLRQGTAAVPGRHPATTAFVRDSTPGAVTAAVKGRRGTAGPFTLRTSLPGDIKGTGQVTLADLQAFSKAYLSTVHGKNYDPAADANQNGRVGQGDARLLLRNLTPLTPKIPLVIDVTLAPQDAAKGPTPKNSGGVTHHQTVTILGRTTPGSIVFADSSEGNYSFRGPALPTNAQGDFALQVKLSSGINNYEFLAIDPYGQQTIRAYPIFWLDYAAPGSPLK